MASLKTTLPLAVFPEESTRLSLPVTDPVAEWVTARAFLDGKLLRATCVGRSMSFELELGLELGFSVYAAAVAPAFEEMVSDLSDKVPAAGALPATLVLRPAWATAPALDEDASSVTAVVGEDVCTAAIR